MDNLPLQFHPEARIEALQAHDWCAERSTSAAEAFQDELQDARRAIQAAPDRWASFIFGTRRYIMKRFPFVVVYRVATIAVAGDRQVTVPMMAQTTFYGYG